MAKSFAVTVSDYTAQRLVELAAREPLLGRDEKTVEQFAAWLLNRAVKSIDKREAIQRQAVQ